MTLNNLATLQRVKNEFEKAEQSYTEALAISRKLAEVNPQTYLPDVGMTLNNLAILQRAKNEFEKAEQSYTEALAIYRKLAEVNPHVYLIYYSKTAISLSLFYLSSVNDRDKSSHYANEVINWLNPFRFTLPQAEGLTKKAEDILKELNKKQ